MKLKYILRMIISQEWWIIRFSPFFDPNWYCKAYPEVAQSGMDPAYHYLIKGWLEGRDPGPNFSTRWYLESYPDVKDAGINPLVHYLKYGRREGKLPKGHFQSNIRIASILDIFPMIFLMIKNPKKNVWIWKRSWEIYRESGFKEILNPTQKLNYSLWISRYDTLNKKDKIKIKNHIKSLHYCPQISILLNTSSNDSREGIQRSINSVIKQLYPYWELIITNSNPNLKFNHPKVKLIPLFNKNNVSLNDVLNMTTGEFVTFLNGHDELSEHALYMVAVELNRNCEAALIYSDEDKIDDKGIRFDPYFKPNWDPDLILEKNYISNLLVLKKSVVKKIGGFRKQFEGVDQWDIILRLTEHIHENQIVHIPFVLYHKHIKNQDENKNLEKKILLDTITRRNIQADLIYNSPFWRMKFYLPRHLPKVSIVIPTKGQKDYIFHCIESILKSTYKSFEIIIVYHSKEKVSRFRKLDHFKFKTIHYKKEFNFSLMNNLAAKLAQGQILLFLNDDTQIISKDWLEEIVSHLYRTKVGAVGAMLYYPDNSIQHAGIILGIGGIAGHAYRRFPRGYPGYMGHAKLIHNVSAVTGACLATWKKVFKEVGGFNEDLAVAFNDIDLCLRIRERGYRIVWTPFAELYHYEGLSRGQDTIANPRFLKEIEIMRERWGKLLDHDPYYNPNLTLEREDFSLSFPPRVSKPWERN